MAKVKLSAGAELDLLNKDEVLGVLKSWQNELSRGARIIRHSINGTVAADGTLTMGDNRDGPSEGMVWGITRFSVAPGATLGAGGLSVYLNDTNSPSGVLISKLVTDIFCDARGAMINSGDSLRIVGSGLTANTQITVTLSARDVPAQMAWSL